MSNIRFYYDNLVDALPGTSISTSSEVSTLPVENLQDAFRTRVWRSAVSSAVRVEWDLGAADSVQYVALVNHNISVSGTVTVQGASDSAFTAVVYVAVFDAWEPLVGFGEGGFGEFGFGGYLAADQLDELAAGAIRIFDLGGTYDAQYWRIIINDPANASGYVEAGRLYCGRYWEPEEQFEWKWRLTPMDESSTDYSEGGQSWVDIVEKRWQVQFDLALIRNEERYWRAADMLRRFGVRKDMLISMWPETASGARFFTTLYGRFDRVPSLIQDSTVYSSADIVFRESL